MKSESPPKSLKGSVMFSNKKEDTAVAEPDKPFESVSRPAYDKPRAFGHSIVEDGLLMKGDLETEGDILVKGKVFGNIKCKVLIIDTGALVEGGVEAEEVIIRGNSKGTIKANRVALEKSASVESDICHKIFSAEEGARIKGGLRFQDDPLGVVSEPTSKAHRSTKIGNGISTVSSPLDSPN
jgi:cytoskeletal protein CcmA (bactofilin family)